MYQTLHVLFKGDEGQVAQAPFTEVITYDAFPDGLAMNVSKIGIMQFGYDGDRRALPKRSSEVVPDPPSRTSEQVAVYPTTVSVISAGITSRRGYLT